MLLMISTYHKTQSVLLAIVILLVVFIGITLLSLQTTYDFISCLHYSLMVSFLLAFITFGIVSGVASLKGKLYDALYGGLAALLVTFYVIFEAHMLTTGQRGLNLEPIDYLATVLQLYFDIYYPIYYIIQRIMRS